MIITHILHLIRLSHISVCVCVYIYIYIFTFHVATIITDLIITILMTFFINIVMNSIIL
jgi:hypothetical protein